MKIWIGWFIRFNHFPIKIEEFWALFCFFCDLSITINKFRTCSIELDYHMRFLVSRLWLVWLHSKIGTFCNWFDFEGFLRKEARQAIDNEQKLFISWFGWFYLRKIEKKREFNFYFYFYFCIVIFFELNSRPLFFERPLIPSPLFLVLLFWYLIIFFLLNYWKEKEKGNGCVLQI